MKQNELHGIRIHISGIVQGVGFRPFVYGLATRYGLVGWVRNTSAGVDIEVDGARATLEQFAAALRHEAPPLARIDAFETAWQPADGFTSFEIVHSEAIEGAFQPISPDVCVCADCLAEMYAPQDRRYRYPFTNCTNCGPRFTIIQDIPYDRPKTTMAGFPLCPECGAEYADPLNRRFHAQPVACPVCGPHVWLEEKDSGFEGEDAPAGEVLAREAAIQAVRRRLAQGQILAIKGLGGFHLACDARNPHAVAELRRRKLRVDKPFALMLRDLEAIQQYCRVSAEEAGLLTSGARPIVLLERRPGTTIAQGVAPRQHTLGVMLPYTPLHYLLFETPGEPSMTALVMTSGNLSEEPIATNNEEARQRLGSLADAFLMHNRPIHVRCDDSVLRVGASLQASQQTHPLRRSRGYTPFPVRLPWEALPLLAAGAELKNTFCLTRERYAFLSHHIGDLENYETLRSFEDGVAHFERLFRVQPQALAYDLHPNYLATRYALSRAEAEGLPAVGVQHHHAHIAACMAENDLPGDQPILGVAFDGTGYGTDGAIWGGEFLLADYRGFQRLAHLRYVPLPGGDAAVRKPARMALAHLWQSGIEWDGELPSLQTLCAEEQLVLRSQLSRGLNSPLTSSMGRLFDAAAALIGGRQSVNYEAQAAIEMEALADPDESGLYPFELRGELVRGELIRPGDSGLQIDPAPVLLGLLDDWRAGVAQPVLAARFHNSVAEMVLEMCQHVRQAQGIEAVALSGGVWQNLTLLGKTLPRLEAAGFRVYLHQQVPANDGGLALGQAAVAINTLKIAR